MRKPKQEKKNKQKELPRGVFFRNGAYWIHYFGAYSDRHRERAGTLSQAIRLYQYRKAAAWEGKKLPTSVRMKRVVKFSELVEDMLVYSKANKKSYDDDVYRTNKLLEEFKEKPAESITPQQFERFLDQRGIALGTKNRYRAVLKLIYRLGEENGKISTNPARKLRMKKENNIRLRFFDPKEEERLRAVIRRDYPSREVDLDVALNTGVRMSEQYRIEWQDVDLERRILTVPTSKTGGGRHIPLNDAAVSAFQSLAKEGGNNRFVFLRTPGHGAGRGERVKCPRAWFEDAVEKAGVVGVTWHGLRRTFASRLVMRGVDIRTVADLLGHATIQMTMAYAYLAPEHKLQAVQRLAAFAPNKDVVVS
jgi:integrase